MARYVFLFPGQGSQYVGMGKDLYEAFSEAKAVYDRAEEILGLPIRHVSFEGPDQELVKTNLTQPALLTHSLACCAVLKEHGVEPALTAGHSVGEYPALYAAGALGFDDVFRLIKKRGELTNNITRGTMAAIIGIDDETVRHICAEVTGLKTDGIVVPANFNAPDQVVISGDRQAVEKAAGILKEKGAKRAVVLAISGAFHSPLTTGAAAEFKQFLAGVTVHPPKVGVVQNVTGELVSDPALLRANLEVQLTSSVLWTKSVRTMKALGFTQGLEAGPGRVLGGLVKRIERDFVATPVGKADEIAAFLAVHAASSPE